jgi:uracil-DNA glycosylase
MLSNISAEWLNILNTDNLNIITDELSNVDTVPPAEQIFEFARLTPFDKIKCVIIGQDPYPTPGDAHGLAFSCLTGIPKSLRNIYKCLLKQKLIKELPDTGDLTCWAKQGVLLLNTALTTTLGKPLAHVKLWREYTNELISKISQIRPLVFILLGDKAQTLRKYIHHKAVVLEWGHPSPLARNADFINCPCFSDANTILNKLGEKPIDWNINLDPLNAMFSDNRTLVLFTDGSCFPNKLCPQSVGGYAAVFAHGAFKDVLFYGNLDTNIEFATNQRAEGFAILNALNYMKDPSKLDAWDSLIIITDSQFWIDMFNKYMPSWQKGNKFLEKKNPDLTVALWAVYIELLKKKKNISFKHVRSHDKAGWSSAPRDSYEYFCYINNDYVDKIAEFARQKVSRGKKIISIAKYDN